MSLARLSVFAALTDDFFIMHKPVLRSVAMLMVRKNAFGMVLTFLIASSMSVSLKATEVSPNGNVIKVPVDMPSKSIDESPPQEQTIGESREEKNSPPASWSSQKPVSVSDASNWPIVLLSLSGIVVLILMIAWLVRRMGGLQAVGILDMRVVSALPLGTREKIAVVDVNGQQFLIGITAQNISLLHSFDEPAINTESKGASDFAAKLQGLMKAQNASEKSFETGRGQAVDPSKSDAKHE